MMSSVAKLNKKRDAFEDEDSNDEIAEHESADEDYRGHVYKIESTSKSTSNKKQKHESTANTKRIMFFNGVLIGRDHKLFVDSHGKNCTTKRWFSNAKFVIEAPNGRVSLELSGQHWSSQSPLRKTLHDSI